MQFTLLIFIINEVSSEWVEISQQHYRQPINRQILNKHADNTYSNQSLVDTWRDSIHRKPSTNNREADISTSNVFQSTTIKTFTIETDDKSITSDEFKYTEIPFLNKEHGFLKRVPNLGSVQRVHLAKTPVRSPNLKHSEAATFQNVRKDIVKHPNEDIKIKPILDKSKNFVNETNFFTETNPYSEATGSISTAIRSTPTFPMSHDTLKEDPTTNRQNFTNRQNLQQNKQKFVKRKDHLQENIISQVHRGEHEITETNIDNSIIVNENEPPINVQNETLSKGSIKSTKTSESNVNNNNHEDHQNKQLKEKSKPHKENSNQGNNKDVKSNSMENLMKFMKVVSDTISKNTRSEASKVQYLEELKKTIISNIADRIDATWPDDSRPGRHARSAEVRGHVEFPSSESSLMTISFLTFAVFLIKLVLQVIHTYKNKAMMVAPLVVATAGRAFNKMRPTNVKY